MGVCAAAESSRDGVGASCAGSAPSTSSVGVGWSSWAGASEAGDGERDMFAVEGKGDSNSDARPLDAQRREKAAPPRPWQRMPYAIRN